MTLKAFFTGFSRSHNIYTDKKRLQQVILNLQSNAIKFTKDKGIVEIQVTLVPKVANSVYFSNQLDEDNLLQGGRRSKVVVTVVDQGVGIKDCDL